jgi:hypothetical protein
MLAKSELWVLGVGTEDRRAEEKKRGGEDPTNTDATFRVVTFDKEIKERNQIIFKGNSGGFEIKSSF